MDAARVRAVAQQIVHQHQFAQPSRSLWFRFWSWVGRGVDDVFNAIFSHGHASIPGLIVVAAILVVAVVVGTRLAGRISRDPGVDVRSPAVIRRTPDEWSAEAARHEAAGRWRDAMRCRYRALVADLAGRGVLDEVPGRTAREYAAIVTDQLPPPAAPAFREASDLFEVAWYGNQPSSADELHHFRDLEAQVLQRA